MLASANSTATWIPPRRCKSPPRWRKPASPVVEIIREFRYPTEYTQDQERTGKPWVPSAFETRNCGVTLEVVPTLMESGIIDFTVAPQVVEFLGFISYPSGKVTPGESRARAEFPERLISPKAFAAGPSDEKHQPVFSSWKTHASVSIASGNTLLFVGPSSVKPPG